MRLVKRGGRVPSIREVFGPENSWAVFFVFSCPNLVGPLLFLDGDLGGKRRNLQSGCLAVCSH